MEVMNKTNLKKELKNYISVLVLNFDLEKFDQKKQDLIVSLEDDEFNLPF